MQPEYEKADSFQPAAPVNFTVGSEGRVIRRIVIHITAGGTTRTNVADFQNPNRKDKDGKPVKTSSHYIVGRDGEIVQLVRHKDISHHAHAANEDSIGIEHVATAHEEITKQQYQRSADLTHWLCDELGIPLDRQHIIGHREADPKTDHACPGKFWDWDQYMLLVRDVATQGFAFLAGLTLSNQMSSWQKRVTVRFTMQGKGIGMNAHPLGRNSWSCLEPNFVNLLAWDTCGGFWYENNQYTCYDKCTARQRPAFVLQEPPEWDGDNKHVSRPGRFQILNPRNSAGCSLIGTWTRIG